MGKARSLLNASQAQSSPVQSKLQSRLQSSPVQSSPPRERLLHGLLWPTARGQEGSSCRMLGCINVMSCMACSVVLCCWLAFLSRSRRVRHSSLRASIDAVDAIQDSSRRRGEGALSIHLEDVDAIQVFKALDEPVDGEDLRAAHRHARVVNLLVGLVGALGVTNLRLQVVIVLLRVCHQTDSNAGL